MQKLVKTQAKEITALKRKEQLWKGKEKVVEEDPVQGVEKQPQQGKGNLENDHQNPANNGITTTWILKMWRSSWRLGLADGKKESRIKILRPHPR